MRLSPVGSVRRFLTKVGADRAVIYGLLGTSRGLLLGPLTALIIAFTLSGELQGFYYTFAGLLALQVFLELGFAQVIVQFASHEWAQLRLRSDRSIEGNPDALARLSSLWRLTTRWYWRTSLLLWIGLAVAGFVFFSAEDSGVQWQGPWLIVTLATAIDFMLLPLWSLMQGANLMTAVNFARLVGGLLLVPVLWGGLLLGAELWSLAMAEIAGLVWDAGFLWRYRQFFRSLHLQRRGPRIQWRREILPVQWRMAMTWVSGYFAMQIFIPVIFRLEGPIEAGRWGMTWSVVSAVSALAGIWIYTSAPRFGSLIAQRRYRELDEAFRRVTASALGLCGLASIGAIGAIALLNTADFRLADRLLPTGTAACLFAAAVLMQLSFAQSTYLRAHKAEPFLGLSILQAVCMAGTTVALGSLWGTAGIAAGYLGVALLIVTPLSTWLFLRLRRDWHQVPDRAEPDADTPAVT